MPRTHQQRSPVTETNKNRKQLLEDLCLSIIESNIEWKRNLKDKNAVVCSVEELSSSLAVPVTLDELCGLSCIVVDKETGQVRMKKKRKKREDKVPIVVVNKREEELFRIYKSIGTKAIEEFVREDLISIEVSQKINVAVENLKRFLEGKVLAVRVVGSHACGIASKNLSNVEVLILLLDQAEERNENSITNEFFNNTMRNCPIFPFSHQREDDGKIFCLADFNLIMELTVVTSSTKAAMNSFSRFVRYSKEMLEITRTIPLIAVAIAFIRRRLYKRLIDSKLSDFDWSIMVVAIYRELGIIKSDLGSSDERMNIRSLNRDESVVAVGEDIFRLLCFMVTADLAGLIFGQGGIRKKDTMELKFVEPYFRDNFTILTDDKAFIGYSLSIKKLACSLLQDLRKT